MWLQKLCNHAFLLPDAEAEIVNLGQDPIEEMISASGKLEIIDKLLAKLSQTKARVFSQMVRVFDILKDFYHHR
jgi:SNF2 family DNA or RNA helicase